MLATLHPGAPSADEVAALLVGVRQLDDAIDTLTQVRIELGRLVADSHWRSDAVDMLRASLIERAADVSERCAAVEGHRDVCLRGVA
ncbi:hypothetical protein FVO59_05290 [Microbacterium esteraromaticum]|uniref:Uncharacterized protein n=1 Tax=Microbacterium esteraromaticum TaxID=57043 RepID=A0A7D7W8A7_9MICO|nr:hypothetical protein [Microbacterium esteraromaticum]QMU96695.1 hypothetical protein FVO59_05290 [Microbacterium esteraromaticum]